MENMNPPQECRIFDTRNEMVKFYAQKCNAPRGLEIGVYRGDFLKQLIQYGFSAIDAVDLFEGMMCCANVDGNNMEEYDIGRSYKELTEEYKDRPHIRFIKSDSVFFLQRQPDEYYDIIYIDGDHSYEGAKHDLFNAFRKIKNGGYIMGHDYEFNFNKAKNYYKFGVKQAVDEFCAIYSQQILAKGMDGCVSYCIQVQKEKAPFTKS